MGGYSDSLVAQAEAEKSQEIRTEALDQAVQSYAHDGTYVVAADIIARAKEFEKYLRGGE